MKDGVVGAEGNQANDLSQGWLEFICGLFWKIGRSEPVDLQQNLQQPCAFGLRLGFGCASASILSPYLKSINCLFTNTYKCPERTVDPKVEGSSPFGLVQNRVFDDVNAVLVCAHWPGIPGICAEKRPMARSTFWRADSLSRTRPSVNHCSLVGTGGAGLHIARLGRQVRRHLQDRLLIMQANVSIPIRLRAAPVLSRLPGNSAGGMAQTRAVRPLSVSSCTGTRPAAVVRSRWAEKTLSEWGDWAYNRFRRWVVAVIADV
jgi:hypothetical protein